MRTILSLAVTTSLLALSAGAFAATKAPAAAPAATPVPLSAPLGVINGAITPPLPPGVTAEQLAMAAAAGMGNFGRPTEVYADAKGMTLYTYDPSVKLSIESSIGDLIDNAATKVVVEKHLPGLSTNPLLAQARGLNFGAVKRFLPILTDDKIKAIAADLAAVPAPPAAPTCVDACAKEWPPFVATANAQAGGLWTIAARPDGTKQWMFDGKAVHTYSKDTKMNEAKGNKLDGGKWNQAVVKVIAPMPMPNGFKVAETMNYDGKVIIAPSGMTLYTNTADKPGVSTCSTGCTKTWKPLEAPRIAVPIGDFSILSRDDGTKQWAFKSKPLYTFAGDAQTGDAKGEGMGGQWHQAMLVKYYFPNAVQVLNHPKHGPMLATAQGATLYARDAHRFTLAGGAHDDRGAMRGSVGTGMKIGVGGCVDDCLKNFTPFRAGADAQPWGDWLLVDRPDGTKQWAYRGYPLYTYVDDKQAGDTIAHDMYQLTDGTTGLFWRVALP